MFGAHKPAPSHTPALTDQGLPQGYPYRPDLEITPRSALELHRKGQLKIVDVRTQAEWDLVHIPGSEHIPLDEIERRAEDAAPEPGQQVAVLCHHGVRSMKATLALRHLGIANARSIAGGIELWSLAADTSVPRYDRSSGTPRLI